MPKDRLRFVKEGRARYISHLDLMRTFQRAFVRADIPIKHTEGFNPHPFISIALPLSLGFASQCEILEFGLLPGIEREDVPGRLNAALPEGVQVLECYEGVRPMKELCWLDYEIALDVTEAPDALEQAWATCLQRENWVVEKPSKKAKSGAVSIDIPTMIKEFHFTHSEDRGLILEIILSAQNPGLNPSVLVNALTSENPQFQPEAVCFRRLETLDNAGKIFK